MARTLIPLLMLFLAENFTYPVLHYYQWVTDRDHFPALELFLPLLIGTGGNAGSRVSCRRRSREPPRVTHWRVRNRWRAGARIGQEGSHEGKLRG